MEKEEAKVGRELFAEYGVNAQHLKELHEFLHSIQEFVQYLGTNQYYSETVNKKIYILMLDVDASLLQVDELSLAASAFKEKLLRALLRKKKESLDRAEVARFIERLCYVERQVRALHERAVSLTEDIRDEYKKKDHL